MQRTHLSICLALTLLIAAGAIGKAPESDRAAPPLPGVASIQTADVVEVEGGAEPPARPFIQIAILLDTSGSMSGLIAQAKSELWKIVNEFIGTRRDGARPELRVALYEYGNDGLPSQEGFIRRILPLTDDLDKVSQELFALTTNGGSEFCGQVIDRAARDLEWSDAGDDLKLIFIAGNEPFTQGPVDYAKAVAAAIGRGIMVNTIHCGSYEDGVSGKWKDGALLADGNYTHIDQNRRIVQIDAPQDEELARLGVELNKTYIAFGADGERGRANQREQDGNSLGLSTNNGAIRAVCKANGYYKNGSWDLVDAMQDGTVELDKIETEQLPENMRQMTLEQRRAHVDAQLETRGGLQDRINLLNDARKKYVAEKMKERSDEGDETLDQALVKAIRAQAVTKNYTFEN